MDRKNCCMEWLKRTVVIAIGLAIVAFASLPFSSADEWDDIPKKIREAKTPADHQALAAFYEKEAQKAHQLHTTHASMAAAYSAARSMERHDQAAGDMVFVAKKYQEMAKEYEALAAIHKTMAEQLK